MGDHRWSTKTYNSLYIVQVFNYEVQYFCWSLKEDEIELYHLTYATRKGSSAFLANIGNNDDECNDNIDFFHMSQAYETIDKWIRSIDEYELAGAKVVPKIQLKHKSERYSEHIPFIIKCGKR